MRNLLLASFVAVMAAFSAGAPAQAASPVTANLQTVQYMPGWRYHHAHYRHYGYRGCHVRNVRHVRHGRVWYSPVRVCRW